MEEERGRRRRNMIKMIRRILQNITSSLGKKYGTKSYFIRNDVEVMRVMNIIAIIIIFIITNIIFKRKHA